MLSHAPRLWPNRKSAHSSDFPFVRSVRNWQISSRSCSRFTARHAVALRRRVRSAIHPKRQKELPANHANKRELKKRILLKFQRRTTDYPARLRRNRRFFAFKNLCKLREFSFISTDKFVWQALRLPASDAHE